jgi:hypothetical protein
MLITYNEITPSWEDDLSEGTNLGDPSIRSIMLRIVSPLLPLPILVDAMTMDYDQAWAGAMRIMQHWAVSKVRFSNVTDSEMDCLNVKLDDADGRLPWSLIISNACLQSNADGKVVCATFIGSTLTELGATASYLDANP